MKAITPNNPVELAQVAALPLTVGDDGIARVMLLTSRETKRWIIPKGWPMKGRKPCEAAAQEALEEAGLVGRPSKKPIGSYSYFKRREAHFDLCRVDVFLLTLNKQLKNWREKGQREAQWFTLAEAATLVEEAGLIALFLDLARTGLAAQSRAGRLRSSIDRLEAVRASRLPFQVGGAKLREA
jgi:8-oxo-dGTP pyrophosphatase MutT (NUDIX family)